MPERVYMNRVPGECRIHIEIAENEVFDLLDGLIVPDDAADAVKRLHEILEQAAEAFLAQRSGPEASR